MTDTAPASPTLTAAHMLGEMAWLMSQSPQHRGFTLYDLNWMVMPALLHNQFRIYKGGDNAGQPAGMVTWAFLSEAVEARLLAGDTQLSAEDWKSGDRCWIIDVVAPDGTFDNKLVAQIIDDIRRTALKDRTVKLRQMHPTTGKFVVSELKG